MAADFKLSLMHLAVLFRHFLDFSHNKCVGVARIVRPQPDY